MKKLLITFFIVLSVTLFPQEYKEYGEKLSNTVVTPAQIADNYHKLSLEEASSFLENNITEGNFNYFVSHLERRFDFLISRSSDSSIKDILQINKAYLSFGLSQKAKIAESIVKLVEIEIDYLRNGTITNDELFEFRILQKPLNPSAVTGQITNVVSRVYNTSSYSWYKEGAYPGSGIAFNTDITVKNTSTSSGTFLVKVKNEPSPNWDIFFGTSFPYPNQSNNFNLTGGEVKTLTGSLQCYTQTPDNMEQSASCTFELYEYGLISNTLLHTVAEQMKNDVTAPTTNMTLLSPTQPTSSFSVEWGGNDPGIGASGIKHYDIQSKKNNSSWSDWKTATTSTSATFTAEPGNTYSFRSRATDNVLHTSTYPASHQTFTVVLCAPPALYGPENNSIYNTTNGNVNFVWSPSLNANDYWLQVSRNSSFTDLVFNESVGAGTPIADKLTKTLSPFSNNGQSYWWRMRAKGPNTPANYGSYSSAFKFTMDRVFTLSLSKTGSGSGSVKVNGVSHSLPYSENFSSGTSVSLQAVPATNHTFTGWGGDLSGTTNPTSITMNSGKNVSAGFALPSFTLSLTKSGTGSGTVKVNGTTRTLPYTGSFESGSEVTLQAVPAANNTFTGWGGDLSGTTNPTSITMNSGKSVTVGFAPLNFTLSLTKTGTGSGTVKVNGTTRTLPYTGSFESGTVVTLQAVPDANSNFTGWGGDLSGTTNPANITMNSDKSVSLGFAIQNFTLSLTKSGTGSGTVNVNGSPQTLPYSGSFEYGTIVTLHAAPDVNSIFTGWGGDLSGTTNPANITMNSDKSVSLGFAIQNFTLSLTKSGTGSGTVKVNGTTQTLPYTGTFLSGTIVNLEAVPAPNNTFSGWGGDLSGTTNPNSITMNSGKNVSVGFALPLDPTLSITNSGTGSGTVKVNGTTQVLPYIGSFPFGAVVSLQAEPGSNNTFTGWGGDLTGNANPTSITMNSNKNVTAAFAPLPTFTLSLTKSGFGDGTVKVNGTAQTLPYSGTFVTGTIVTLEAVPGPNNTFTGWGGNLSGTVNPTSITMNSNKDVAVGFALMYTLLIAKTGNGNGTIKVNGETVSLPYSGTFPAGTGITLEAIPSPNSTFEGWGALGLQNPLLIILNNNISVSVTFTANYSLNLTKSGTGTGSVKVNDVMQALPYTGTFSPGAQVTLQAMPDINSLFFGWSGSITGATNPVSIQMSSTKDITVGFNAFILTATPESLSVPETAGQVSYNITSNASWQVSTTANWISSITPQNHSGDGVLNVSYMENTDTALIRICSLRVDCGPIVKYLVLVQNKATTSINELLTGTPTEYKLYQNFPNPFNPGTRIIYSVPRTSRIILQLFDITGKQVELLIDEEKQVGNYSLNIDMGQMNSGIYFLRMISGDYVSMKKIILLK